MEKFQINASESTSISDMSNTENNLDFENLAPYLKGVITMNVHRKYYPFFWFLEANFFVELDQEFLTQENINKFEAKITDEKISKISDFFAQINPDCQKTKFNLVRKDDIEWYKENLYWEGKKWIYKTDSAMNSSSLTPNSSSTKWDHILLVSLSQCITYEDKSIKEEEVYIPQSFSDKITEVFKQIETVLRAVEVLEDDTDFFTAETMAELLF